MITHLSWHVLGLFHPLFTCHVWSFHWWSTGRLSPLPHPECNPCISLARDWNTIAFFLFLYFLVIIRGHSKGWKGDGQTVKRSFLFLHKKKMPCVFTWILVCFLSNEISVRNMFLEFFFYRMAINILFITDLEFFLWPTLGMCWWFERLLKLLYPSDCMLMMMMMESMQRFLCRLFWLWLEWDSTEISKVFLSLVISAFSFMMACFDLPSLTCAHFPFLHPMLHVWQRKLTWKEQPQQQQCISKDGTSLAILSCSWCWLILLWLNHKKKAGGR